MTLSISETSDRNRINWTFLIIAVLIPYFGMFMILWYVNFKGAYIIV